MSDALKVFTDMWGQLGKMPVAVIIAATGMIVGLMMKKASRIPNWTIPLAVLLWCAFWYAFLGDTGSINPNQNCPRCILAFYGILLGFVTWAAHKFFLKKLEKFLPEGFFPSDMFDSAPSIPLPDGSNTKRTTEIETTKP